MKLPQITNQLVWLYDSTYGDWHVAKEVGRLIWKNDPTDFRQYRTLEEYKIAYKNSGLPNTNGSYLNSSYCIYKPMQVGDIIVVREGLHSIVAWGEVLSDYIYDKDNTNYQSYREIKWHLVGNIPIKIAEKGVWFSELQQPEYEQLFALIEKRYNDLQRIIDLFVKLHQKKPFNGNEERYKWEAIYKSDLANPVDLIKNKYNLFYRYSYATLAELAESRPQELSTSISKLFDENTPLENRLAQYKKDINELKISGKACPNDERTAAVFLTCFNPQKYTLYMRNMLYLPLCRWLGIDNEKNKAKAYIQYLTLLAPLSEMIGENEDLSKIFADLSKGYETSNLLNAQTLLWCIHNEIVTITENKEELVKFKHLLEYFVAHLNFVQNGKTDTAGYDEYIKPLRDKNDFKYSGQGYDGDAIQNQVKKWESYKNGKMCININPSYGNYTTKSTYINWDGTGLNIIAAWNNNAVEGLMLTNYSEVDGYGKWSKEDCKSSVEELGLYEQSNDINQKLIDLFIEFNKRKKALDMERQNNADKEKYKEYIQLLKSNFNIILTGAPGTGKTYMAHRIAGAMDATDDCIKMVQFHPSYDYTDFVEGLRPNDRGTFSRVDGVFKEFCKKALINLNESTPENNAQRKMRAVQQALDQMLESLLDRTLTLEKTKNQFSIIGNDEKRIHIYIPNNEVVKEMKLRKTELLTLYQSERKIDNVKDVRQVLKRKYGAQDDSYLLVLYKLLKKESIKDIDEAIVPRKNFIFIIDEINRGEISKIFGELFFSIDPGYRGKAEWRVDTQYQNIIEDDDEFKDGFYVPENVYIIGTMNDIDRSVESMDFAMRRRFAFKEVTAKESFENIIKNNNDFDDDLKAEIEKRMNAVNAIIEKELGTEYQIGAAYFLKLKDKDFESLWQNYLKGLISEYFRGEKKDVLDDKMIRMKQAFDGTSTDNTNNGQQS